MAISAASIKINGTTYKLTYNSTSGKWQATINAPGATSYNQSNHYYACEVTASNTAGSAIVVGVSDAGVGDALKLVVKETVKPVVIINSPTSGAYVTNNKQPIVFVVTDESGGSGINLGALVVRLDGTVVNGVASAAIANGYSCVYTPSAALSDGAHTVTVAVSDYDGNAAAPVSTAFSMDTVPPTLNITAPASNLITNSTSVAYSGATNDMTSSPVNVSVELDGAAQASPTVASGGSFSGAFANVTDGEHTAMFTATDAAGKTSSVTRAFTVDTTVPVISAVSITPNPADTGASMIVMVTIT